MKSQAADHPPPPHLNAAAQEKWWAVLPILKKRGPVSQGALDALCAYSSAWSQWIEAEAKVAELGMVVKSAAGFAQENPFLSLSRKAQNEMRKWGVELQITPKSEKTKNIAKPDPPAKAVPARSSTNLLKNLKVVG